MQQTILLTNQLATGSAFALTENNENVFIPSKVMLDKGVRAGQRVQAIVVPNMTRPDRTPWLAVSILDAEPVSRDDTLANFILDNLEQGRATVEEVAEDLNMSDDKIAAKLAEMVADGRVVRLTCYDLPEDGA
jgi:predicted Rossmann fold nucleotide-binding protein DprA/Smf involved in DNA uptake